MFTRFALSVIACGSLLSTLSPAQDTAAAWAQLLRGTSTSYQNPAPHLVGGLRPILGRTATIDLWAAGFTQAALLVGAQASDGVPIPFFGPPLSLYVPQPIAVLPMTMQAGYGSYALSIPDDSSLVGVDLAMQAATTAPGHVGLSNLLLANLGRQGAFSSAWDFEFSGTAAAEQRTANGNVHSGDVEERGLSIPVYSGSGENVWLTIIADRPLTRPLEVRTGTDGRGQLLGQTTRQVDVLDIVVPNGLVHVYLHNTDPSQGVGVRWRIAVY